MLFLKLLFICYFPNVHFYLPVRSFFFFFTFVSVFCVWSPWRQVQSMLLSAAPLLQRVSKVHCHFFYPHPDTTPMGCVSSQDETIHVFKQFFFIIILMIVPFYFVLFFLSYSLYCSWFGKFKKASDDAIKKVLHLHLVWSSRFITNCMCLKTKKQYLVLAPMHLNTSRLNIQYNIFTEDGAVRLKSINNNFSLIVV